MLFFWQNSLLVESSEVVYNSNTERKGEIVWNKWNY
jgi:hypothetical protein